MLGDIALSPVFPDGADRWWPILAASFGDFFFARRFAIRRRITRRSSNNIQNQIDIRLSVCHSRFCFVPPHLSSTTRVSFLKSSVTLACAIGVAVCKRLVNSKANHRNLLSLTACEYSTLPINKAFAQQQQRQQRSFASQPSQSPVAGSRNKTRQPAASTPTTTTTTSAVIAASSKIVTTKSRKKMSDKAKAASATTTSAVLDDFMMKYDSIGIEHGVGYERWVAIRKAWQHGVEKTTSSTSSESSSEASSSASTSSPTKKQVEIDVDTVIDCLVHPNKPNFPQPVPLVDMVDILNELWEVEGLYD